MNSQTTTTVDIDKYLKGNKLSTRFTDVGDFISQIINIVLPIAGVICLVFLIVGGLQWLTSGGDKTKIESARQIITNAIIGIAIVAVSYAVYLLVVVQFFGIGTVAN